MPEAADGLVIFGITGDLARKMTLPALYRLEARGLLEVPVLGVGRTPWVDADLHARLDESLAAAVGEVDPLVHVIRNGPVAPSKHVNSGGSHSDPSAELWLDGKATKPHAVVFC